MAVLWGGRGRSNILDNYLCCGGVPRYSLLLSMKRAGRRDINFPSHSSLPPSLPSPHTKTVSSLFLLSFLPPPPAHPISTTCLPSPLVPSSSYIISFLSLLWEEEEGRLFHSRRWSPSPPPSPFPLFATRRQKRRWIEKERKEEKEVGAAAALLFLPPPFLALNVDASVFFLCLHPHSSSSSSRFSSSSLSSAFFPLCLDALPPSLFFRVPHFLHRQRQRLAIRVYRKALGAC